MKRHDRCYNRIYARLRDFGHTPTKALEILIDARRGDRHALQWIRLVRNHSWGGPTEVTR
jgi:hypothetical protein